MLKNINHSFNQIKVTYLLDINQISSNIVTKLSKILFQVGHLPFLQRSNFQHDVLTGKHLDIGFEDILNTPEMCEVAGQPHAVVERSLGIL